MEDKDWFSDDLTRMDFLGEVVINEDSECLGRLKVKVFGKFDLLDNESIPWSYPSSNLVAGSKTGGSQYSVPKIGSIVSIKFDNGNIYHPIYNYTNKISDELKEEIKKSPKNFHSFVFDTEIEGGLKIFFSEEQGYIINLNETSINIKKDKSINIKNSNGDLINLTNEGDIQFKTSKTLNVNTKKVLIDSSDEVVFKTSKMDLGGDSTEPVLLGNKTKDLLSEILDAITQLTVMTPTGVSLTPVNTPNFIAIKTKLQTILSKQNKTK